MISIPGMLERALPNSINVGGDTRTMERGRRDVLRAGGSEFTLDLTDVSSADHLVSVWSEIFSFPWPVHGIDAIISIGSDLYWIPGTRNFWVVVTGIDAVPTGVLKGLSVALPNIIDRMRSSGSNYTVAFGRSPRTDEFLRMLNARNDLLAYLEQDAHTNDTHPITVVDHRGARPRVVGRTHHFDAFPVLANAVHLPGGPELLRTARTALDPGRDALSLLDLTGVRSTEDLLSRGSRSFDTTSPATEVSQLVPTEASNHGWSWRRFSITLVTNVDEVPSPLLRQLAWLLAGRVDHIRALGEREAVLFPPTPRSDELLGLLAAENRALDALGEATQGNIFPIAVLDHRRDQARA